jgi:hypothetical protein
MGLRKVGIVVVGLLVALNAFAQQSGNYGSFAVMDFRIRGVTRDEMRSAVDRLSMKILETQGFRRVISPERREQLLQEAGGGLRLGSYHKRQLHNAEIIGVELAVLGEIRKQGAEYLVDLRLLEVASADTLFRNQYSYSNLEDLSRDAGRLATILVRASRQPRVVEPENGESLPRRTRRDLEVVAGVRLGQESVTEAPGVDGGSHLYLELLAELNRLFGLSVKYSVGLFPVYSENHLVTILPRVNIRLAEEVYTAISTGYMISTDYHGELHHHLGARFAPIYSGNMEGISIEAWPVSLFFDLSDGSTVFMLELISIAFWRPYE